MDEREALGVRRFVENRVPRLCRYCFALLAKNWPCRNEVTVEKEYAGLGLRVGRVGPEVGVELPMVRAGHRLSAMEGKPSAGDTPIDWRK